MRLLLVSDIHLGVKQNSETFLNNTRDFFLKQISPAITSNKIDQLWILGDLFDCRNNTNVLVNNVALQIIATLVKNHPTLPIRILAGNHDIYYKNTLSVTSLKIFKRFHKNVEVISEITEYNLDGCPTLVVPWLVKNSQNYNKFINICKEPKKYSLCLGHFEVNGFEIIKGVVEKSGFNEDLFKVFDNVFTGHFHLRNKISNIQYLGCPYEITWNDFGDHKGFTIFDTTTKISTFCQNTISPKHKKIIYSSTLLDESLMNDITGNFIKFYIDEPLSTEQRIELDIQIEAKKPLYCDVINEVIEGTDENGEDIQLSNINGDTLTLIDEYNAQLPLPIEIKEDEFKLYMKKLYDETVLEDE